MKLPCKKMEEINSKSKQEECLNAVMTSVDHTAEGKGYLEDGLNLIKNGKIDEAIESFFHAAASFDRAQDFQQITAIWEAIGNLLEPDVKEKYKEFLELLQEGKIREVYDKWYQFPLVYRVSVASRHVWEGQKDPVHKQAWAYQWAAQHREFSGNYRGAYQLFLKAAEKAEQTEDGKEYPEWPGRLWYKAIFNYISNHGTIENEEIEKAISGMENNYLKRKDKAKRYNSLAIAYRNIKSQLMKAGNLTEAEQFKKKERSALMRYYFYSKSYFRAIVEWISGIGFMYFIIALFLMVLFVFPYIYYQWDLITPAQGKITYSDAILYSFESALNIGHSEYYAVGVGKLVNIIEAALSWLGLGVFIWWITRRLE